MEKQQPKIKLGIDAKWFFAGPPSGTMVVKNLVDNIIAQNERFQLYLFFPIAHKKLARNHFPREVKMIFLPAIPNIFSNMLLVPLAAWAYGLDIMLFQNFISSWPCKLFKVAYIHDMLFLDYPQYYNQTEQTYFKYMQRSATKADMVITISHTEKQRIANHGLANGNKVAVVHHGINENFKPLACYPPELRSHWPDCGLPSKYLLYVGRINVRKNLFNLVKALGMLDDMNIKLVVAGEKSRLNDRLQRFIDEGDLHNRVIFTGHVKEDELYQIYAHATVFCFPSFAEGFGLPPLEAMQCGVPVVVSNRTAMPEVCGNAALYINPDDAADIAKKLNLLLNNHLFYMQKAAAGIIHSRNFSWKKAAGNVLNLINNAYDHRQSYRQA